MTPRLLAQCAALLGIGLLLQGQTTNGRPGSVEFQLVLGALQPISPIKPVARNVPVQVLRGKEIFAARSDKDGRVRIGGLPPGTYELPLVTFERRSAGTTTVAAAVPKRISFTVESGKRKNLGTMEVSPSEGSFRGTVTDNHGVPIAGAHVHAFRQIIDAGLPGMRFYPESITDDQGQYLLKVPSGHLLVQVIVPARMFPAQGTQPEHWEAYAPAYYPGTGDLASAKRIELGAGSDLSGINFVLTPSPSFHIRGTLQGSLATEGQPQIEVYPCPNDDSVATLTSSIPVAADGSFDIPGRVPGIHCLRYQSYDTAPANLTTGPSRLASAVVTVTGGDVEQVRLTAIPTLTLSGTYVDKDQSGPGGAVSLIRNDKTLVRQGMLDGNGSFKIGGVAPGEYKLAFHLPRTYGLTSAMLDGQDVSMAAFTVGTNTGPLAITIAKRRATVSGDVGNPIRGGLQVRVLMVPDDPRPRETYHWQEWSAATTPFITTELPPQPLGGMISSGVRPMGSFLVPVAPGKYRVYAWEEYIPDLVTVPGFLDRFQAKTIEVYEGRETKVDLKLISAEDSRAAAADF